jgi:hypothetical protein
MTRSRYFLFHYFYDRRNRVFRDFKVFRKYNKLTKKKIEKRYGKIHNILEICMSKSYCTIKRLMRKQEYVITFIYS